MKKTTLMLVLLLGALLFVLTGCGSSSTDTPSAVVTVTETPAEQVLSQDDQYLQDLYALDDSRINASSDSTLLSIGHNTCDALDNGSSFEDLVLYLVNSGSIEGVEESAGKILAVAVGDFCPSYFQEVQDFANKYSN